jgi:hypothetical protein
VILVAAFLLLVALGLLVGGLAQESAALEWGSFAASALAALALGAGELRRRRAGSADDTAEAVSVPTGRDRATGTARQAGAGALVAAPATSPNHGEATERTAALQPMAAQPGNDGRPGAADRAVLAPAATATGAHAVQSAEPTTRSTAAAHVPQSAGPTTGAHAAVQAVGVDGEPPVEVVEVTDLLLVLDLTDEVLVIDEHPRYHLADCPYLTGQDTIPMPMDEARADGFTPCGTCAPDRNLAERERTRRAGC